MTLAACDEQWRKTNAQKTSGQATFLSNSPTLAAIIVSAALVSEETLIAAGGQS